MTFQQKQVYDWALYLNSMLHASGIWVGDSRWSELSLVNFVRQMSAVPSLPSVPPDKFRNSTRSLKMPRWVPTLPITVAESRAWTVFASYNVGVVGSNPTRGKYACIRWFYLCCPVCSQRPALIGADPPSKQSCWLYIGLGKCKSEQGLTKGL
jgi:hypothetical protein